MANEKRLIDANALIKEACAEGAYGYVDAKQIADAPTVDAAPVRHGRCPICSGRKILTQDCYNDYSVEVDAEQEEMSIWQGDACLAVISIGYCPNCGARMHEEASE